MIDTPTTILENFVTELQQVFELHNVSYKKINHGKPNEHYEVGLGGSTYLVRTVVFSYYPNTNKIVFTTKIITDTEMYQVCKILANKYKNTDSLFIPSDNFEPSLGGNSIVNVKLNVTDQNMDDIKTIMKLIEFRYL